jgi:TRAP transporter TAXI family solute receptor
MISLVLFAAVCAFGAAKEKPNDIVITTSAMTNTFYYIGAGQAKILDEAIKGITYSVEASTGTKENLVFTSTRADTMGISPLDYCYAAYTGDASMDFPDPMSNLRLVMTGHSTSVHFAVLENSPIKSFGDLRGKKIGLPPNTSGYFVALRLFAEYGIGESDYSIVLLSPSEAGDALKDGTIDLAVFSGGAPIAAVTDLNMSKRIRLLALDDPKIADSFFSKYPFYYQSAIAAGTYTGINSDIISVNFPISLVCNENLDDDIVYEIVKALNENTDKLAEIHVLGKAWNTKNTLANFTNPVVPFHDGAIRYYEEAQK